MNLKPLLYSMILLAGPSAACGSDFVLIANPSLHQATVSASELRQIYLGTKSTLNGQPVEPVIAQSGPFHAQFVSGCLGKTESGLRNYFRNLVFSGKGSIPRSFASSADVVSYVAKTPGAIGYVDSDEALTGVAKLTLR